MQSARVVEAVGKHTGTVIFLHGLGDAGTSFIPMAQLLQRQHPHLKFILPTAKTRPITLNSGYPMPAWFDVRSLDKLSNSVHDDEAGMLESVASVESLIDQELQTITEDRIIVGGFSQGCVISVLTGLRTKRKIAGVIGLSGWVPLNHKIAEMAAPGAKDLAIFWGHGKQDGVVQYQCEDALATCVSDDVILIQSLGTDGEMSAKLLQNLGLPLVDGFARPGLRFQGYDGVEHSFSDKELRDMSAWLKEAVP